MTLPPDRVAELRAGRNTMLSTEERDALLDAADENARLRAERDELLAAAGKTVDHLKLQAMGGTCCTEAVAGLRAVVARIRAKEMTDGQ